MGCFEIAIIALSIWNIITFFVYGLDKRKAQCGKYRINEKTLIMSAVFMGGLGALMGMHIFRHKTRRTKFKIGVPLALILNIAFLWAYFMFINAF